jgi:damage-control phosphatase, subfamily I
MKVYYECAACLLRQAKEAMDLATPDDHLKMEITEKIIKELYDGYHKEMVPNVIGSRLHRIIKELTKNQDPYMEERRKCNQIAKKFLPPITNILDKDENLECCLKASILGNLIDYGAFGMNFDVDQKILNSIKKGFAINYSDKLEKTLKTVENVLFLADNVGEIVFDKILIKKLKEYDVEVTVALKEKPILNDAVMEDALKIGLDKISNLISIGTDSIGIIYEETSYAFKKTFIESDLVIGKGMGNYEGLSELKLNKPIFCLLNAKCKPVARDIGVNQGDNIVLML